MKIHLLPGIIARIIIHLSLLSPAIAYGQTGNTRQNPIIAGTYSGNFQYANSQNTTNFTNNFTGRSTNDVFYKFTLNKKMEVIIKHCDSSIDTYLHLMDASENVIAYNDDYYGENTCSDGRHSYLKRELEAGTYYVVSEGYSQNGVILTQISGSVIHLPGDSRQDPISVGIYNNSFQYSNTQNTVNFTNQYTGRSTNDVFYCFTIYRNMNVTLTHCGSSIDTYMHLLDAFGNVIASNDDYSGDGYCSSSTFHSFIRQTLKVGTYYIVSEGYSQNNLITTNITASASEFDYQDIPDVYSTEPDPVGSIDGQLNVSPTGAAIYSIPIEVPAGVGGMQPALSIVYNSQAGNGVAGWGCNISGFSVITRTPKSIYYDGNAKGMTRLADEAYMLDGQRLIYSSGTVGQEGAVYYPETDPFTKIIVHGTYNASAANTWFEVLTKDGMKYQYGNTSDSRQTYNAGSSPRINSWYLNQVEDILGNYMNYAYFTSYYFTYLSTITYGQNKNETSTLQNKITFDYEQRPDRIPFVIEGNRGYLSSRLLAISCETGSHNYRTYIFNYDNTSDHFSRLTTVTVGNEFELLKPLKLDWSFLPAFNQSVSSPTVSNTYVPLGVYGNNVAHSEQTYLSCDLNGDGLADLIGLFPYKNYSVYNSNYKSWSDMTIAYVYLASLNASGNIQFNYSNYYNLGDNVSIEEIQSLIEGISPIDFDGDGTKEIFVPRTNFVSSWKQILFCFFHQTSFQGIFVYDLKYSGEMPVYATGDMNNDGKGDVIFMEKGHSSNKYPCIIVGYNQGTSLYNGTFNLTLPSKPERMFVSDFNGDGMDDVLTFYAGGYTVFWNQGNGISNSTLSDSRKTTGTNIGNVNKIQLGDFNGDGLPDFIMNAKDDRTWYFALNNGNGTFEKQAAYTFAENIHDQDTNQDNGEFNCQVFDFDGDNKSDIVITKAVYTLKHSYFLGIVVDTWWSYTATYRYWMRSTGTTLEKSSSAIYNTKEDARSEKFVLGDFNGDGSPELMHFGNDGSSTASWKIYNNSGFSVEKGKITSITSGYGSPTTISYASLTNKNIYTKGTGSSYPVIDCTVPLHAVKTTGLDAGSGTMNVNYQYAGLKVHAQGKGVIGMTSQTATNTTTNVVTESGIKSINTTFYVPEETYTKTTVDNKTAESSVKLTIADKGSKKIFAYPNTKTEKDLDENTTTTTYQFNTSYGYMTEEKTEYGGSGMYQTVQYGSYIQAGGSMPNKPQLTTHIRKHPDDGSTFTQKTYFTYNTSKGYPTRKVENYGSSLPLTTDYTYDGFGNLLSQKISGSGISTITAYNEYEASKRFISKKYTVPAIEVFSYTYDALGNLSTEKNETNSSNTLTTTHTYNGRGQKTSTTFPDGNKITYQTGWNNSATKRYFILAQASGKPWVKTWYDRLGRETLVETVGPKGLPISTSNTYNSKGQLTSTVTKQGSLTITKSNTFDNRGRITGQNSSSGQSIAYTYDNRSVTTTINGQSYTKTYDAWGGIKSSSDPKTTVNYLYKSLGKPQTITASGASFSMTYDNVGNQITLTDPDAGTTTYTYDEAGNLKKQIDGKGKISEIFYDASGRKSYSILDGIRTDYTYGTSGYALNQLVQIKTGNNSINYSYDKYGRTIGEKRQFESGSLLEYTFYYSTKGQLVSTVYPGNLEIGYGYDSYGNQVTAWEGKEPIWVLESTTGLVTTTKLGDYMTATAIRNSQGFLTRLHTVKGNTTILDLNYVFNGATGNLTSRTGMIDQKETFYYDQLDRLTSVKEGAPEQEVMSIGYANNGNITSKTGIGTYSYLFSKPHAIESVDNTDGLISEREQTIGYTAFNKVSHLSENAGVTTIHDIDFTYGPDQQRWETHLNTTLANPVGGELHTNKNIIFAPGYEKITTGTTEKELYYISGNDGLIAVYVKESGQSDKIYYAHTDHLGSIIKLTDANGNTVFSASYDTWGNQTITNNTFAFHRGYTGHEHLPEFELINMNGRMYDPLLGRFLSADPFVQAPDFSQNFNRYSYCLNNPLLYTDPDGEFWHIVIGGLIGGIVNWVAHGAKFSWNGLATFGIGTVGGALFAATGGAALSTFGTTAGAGGFIGGAVASGIGYTYGTMATSIGNNVFFGDPMPTAGQFFSGLGMTMATGGIFNGIVSIANKGNFWTGPKAPQPIVPTTARTAATQNTGTQQQAQNSKVNNPIPEKVARVVPGNSEMPTLGLPEQEYVFVTGADDIRGLNAPQVADKLGIDLPASGFKVYEFNTPQTGIASPFRYNNPLFRGNGLTIGGAREFLIPNQSIPQGATIFRIMF
jgi:RHS repeat-associated protein